MATANTRSNCSCPAQYAEWPRWVGGLGGIDLAAMKRAEAAMETLTGEFGDWIADDVKVLIAARARAMPRPRTWKPRAALLRAAHDIKGQPPLSIIP